jgi:hypothetical protein
MEDELANIWDKLWRDKNGRVVIWQTPNVFLIGWAVLTIVSLFLIGKAANIFEDIATGSLAIWSLLEIFKGVNYFRRLLGAVVMVFAIMFIVQAV